MENNLFDQMANRYDTKDRCDLAKIVIKAIKLKLKNSNNKILIDYGSGTGLVGLELSYLVHNLILIDSSEEMSAVAEEKIKRLNIKNAKIINDDFMISTTHIKADILIVSLVLLHIRDTKKILKKFYSVLNEGGKLIIVDFDKNEKINHPKVHNGFTHIELKKLLSDVGF